MNITEERKEQLREYHREWSRKNKEKVRESHKRWYQRKGREHSNEYYHRTKEQRQEWFKQYYELKGREISRKYYQAHRDEVLARSRKYQKEHKEQHNLGNKEWARSHKEATKARGEKYRLDRKIKVLTHYGNGRLACIKCGISDIRVLSLDHIMGNGYEERKLHPNAYPYVLRNNFPLGYQTLCMNCQMIKRFEEGEHAWGKKDRERFGIEVRLTK